MANGLDVAASDPGPEAEDYLKRFIERARPDLAQLGLTGNGTLSFHADQEEAVTDVGLVQENAPEREELKRDLLARLDRAAPPDVVIASSTSSLLRSRMIQDCATPERIIIAHPFNPPHLVPLVELVGEPGATRWAADFYRAIGKRPVMLKREATGHIANRLTAALFREALYVLEQGIAEVEDIDAAVSYGPGLRWAYMGPFMTYHLGGGPGGLKHYLEHLGPSQVRRWQDLGTPNLNEDLMSRAVEGVLCEAGGRSIEELEAERDEALIRWQTTATKQG
jgi:3-hydroxyacyl-CoA dehydrogenase